MEKTVQTQSSRLQLGTESSIAEIIRSSAPTFHKLKNEGEELNVKKLIALEIEQFIKTSFPATDSVMVSKEFAKDLFERKDWKIADIRMFIKFVKDNAAREEFTVLGNSIGLLTLLKFVGYYENERSAERENHAQRYKESEPTETVPATKEYVEKILNKIKEATPKSAPSAVIHHAFDPIKDRGHFLQFVELVKEFSSEEKEKWHKSIVNFESIDEIEMQRKETILNLLK